MKVFLRLTTILLLISLLIAGGVRVVTAATPTEVTKTAVRERTKQIREEIEAGVFNLDKEERRTEIKAMDEDSRCNQAYINLSALIDFYRTNQNNFTGEYEQLYDNVNNAIEILEENAVPDVRQEELSLTKLKKTNDGLKDDIFALKSNYFSLLDTLEADLEIVCDETYAEINTLKIAIDFLKDLRADTQEVQDQALKVVNELEALTGETIQTESET